MTQKNKQEIKAVTGDEFNERLQQKFDNTVEYVAQRLFNGLNRRIADVLAHELSIDDLIITEYVKELIEEGGSTWVCIDMFEWKLSITATLSATDSQVILREKVIDKLRILLKQWDVTLSEEDHGWYITLNSNFVPLVSVTADEMAKAWTNTCEKMTQYFVRVITDELKRCKGKRSCQSLFFINGVAYEDENISMSYEEGKNIYTAVKDIMHDNGFEMSLNGIPPSIVAMYPGVVYNMELSVLSKP